MGAGASVRRSDGNVASPAPFLYMGPLKNKMNVIVRHNAPVVKANDAYIGSWKYCKIRITRSNTTGQGECVFKHKTIGPFCFDTVKICSDPIIVTCRQAEQHDDAVAVHTVVFCIAAFICKNNGGGMLSFCVRADDMIQRRSAAGSSAAGGN